MALLLDDKLVQEVADVCPAEFLAYYDCLGKGDVNKCLDHQKTLSTCVVGKAPSFKKIIANCKPQMQAYEDCVKKNPEIRTQCFDLLMDMRRCTASALGVKESLDGERSK